MFLGTHPLGWAESNEKVATVGTKVSVLRLLLSKCKQSRENLGERLL